MSKLPQKIQAIIELLIPSYQTDVLARVIEKDKYGKPTHARVLRTPWTTKMRDAFKVIYGQFTLKKVLQDSWGNWGKRLMPPNIVELENFNNPIVTLINYHKNFNDKEFTRANVSDFLLAPFDIGYSLFNLAGSYGISLVTMPLQLLMFAFLNLQYFFSDKSHDKTAKVFEIAAMVVGFAPLIILNFTFQVLNSLLLIARECIKFTLSLVLTAAATTVVSAIDLIASIKSYRLFKLAKNLPLTQHRPEPRGHHAIMQEQAEPETYQQKLKNTREVLSALRRENFVYRIGLNNEIQVFDKRVPGTTRYTVSAQDAKENPNAISAYYQLNLLSTMTAEYQEDLSQFCCENNISLEKTGRIGATMSLNTPLLVR